MPDSGGTTGVRKPRQARSQKTLERMLEVTERLLDERRFESISVQEIVGAAGTSVGAFYARFRDKDALLPELYARYDRALGERLARIRSSRFWEGKTLGQIAPIVVTEFVRLFRDRRNLMRALALYARTRHEDISTETRARRYSQTRVVHEALLSCRDEIQHPDPERAVDLAVFFAASTCRDRILFGESPHAAQLGLSDTELIDELSRMVLGYLGADPTTLVPGSRLEAPSKPGD